jgi:hypothetical protein
MGERRVMQPMFIAFVGNRDGLFSTGWAIADCDAIRTSENVQTLSDEIEKARNYDKGSLVITNFRRLED